MLNPKKARAIKERLNTIKRNRFKRLSLKHVIHVPRIIWVGTLITSVISIAACFFAVELFRRMYYTAGLSHMHYMPEWLIDIIQIVHKYW